MKKIIIGKSVERANDKVFEMSIYDAKKGKLWNDSFATYEQTETSAIVFAKKHFTDCGVIPARIIRGKFWLGFAYGLAAAFILVAIIVAIYLPKLI